MQNITDKMSALALNEVGTDFKLTEQTLSVPKLTDKQLLIKVEYTGLNPVDSKLANSGHGKWQYPHVPGLDGVGIVVDSYTEHCPLIGKRVMWHSDLTKAGALAEYMVIDAHAVAQVPDEVDAAIAAAIPCAGMTALLTLCKLQVEEGETILIDAGAGAVGQFAIQLAKNKGLTVLTTASKSNHAFLSKLGADFVFDYKDPELVLKIKQALGVTPLDAVIDMMGGELTARNIDLIRFNGKVACVNGLSPQDQGLLFSKSPSIHIISLGGAWLSNDMCAQHKLSIKGEQLLEMVKNKELKVPDLSIIDFDAGAVTKAMHAQLKGGVFGKQIVKVS